MKFSGFGTTSEDLAWAVRCLRDRQGAEDLSREACQRWAREFVWKIAPDWKPGRALPFMIWARVGAAFMAELDAHGLLQSHSNGNGK